MEMLGYLNETHDSWILFLGSQSESSLKHVLDIIDIISKVDTSNSKHQPYSSTYTKFRCKIQQYSSNKHQVD